MKAQGIRNGLHWRHLGTDGALREQIRPRDLRDRIAAALVTTDPDAIVAAIADYVGVYEHVEEYVARRIGELLPPAFGWVVHRCDSAALRRRYEAEVSEVWTIPAEGGGALVFESSRGGPQ